MNKILILFLLIPTICFGSTNQFGRIVEIKGSGFISHNGKTHEIKKGEVIYVDSEIVVEHSGQVTFTDNADHRFHLGNATSVGLYTNKVELRSGDLWIQSLNKLDSYKLTSANAEVTYTGGEAIFSYDSVKGKSQLMVINGLMKLANLRAPELNLNVAEGNFSFVDLVHEEGAPRDPTPVGEKTYSKLVSLFLGVSPMDTHSVDIFKAQTPTKVTAHAPEKELEVSVAPQRTIASVTEPTIKKTSRSPHTPKLVKSTGLVVKIYGNNSILPTVTTAIYDLPIKAVNTRTPASVPESVLDQAVPSSDETSTPQYKESEKLIEILKKL